MNELFSPAAFTSLLRRTLGRSCIKRFKPFLPGQRFIPGWPVQAVVHALERVRRGEIRRLIINMPPRSLKSIMASVAFPAFVLGHDPTRRIICVSYAADLARKLSNDFARRHRQPWYQAMFPRHAHRPLKDSEGEIELTARGSRLATSIGGTLTGRGGESSSSTIR